MCMAIKGKWLLKVLVALLLAGVATLAAICGMICWKEANPPVPENYDAIVVLGAQVLPDGNPSVQLEWRLEKALECWQKSPCIIVCSGAQGGNEPAPEGDVMRDWLIARGVPADQVLSETASFNTAQSIRNAAVMLDERGITGALMLTSAYHVPRAMAMAEDAGLEAHGLGCEDTTEHWLRHHARETLSWIKYWGQKLLPLPI